MRCGRGRRSSVQRTGCKPRAAAVGLRTQRGRVCQQRWEAAPPRSVAPTWLTTRSELWFTSEPRRGASASISSKKSTHGAAARAREKSCRTARSLSPTYLPGGGGGAGWVHMWVWVGRGGPLQGRPWQAAAASWHADAGACPGTLCCAALRRAFMLHTQAPSCQGAALGPCRHAQQPMRRSLVEQLRSLDRDEVGAGLGGCCLGHQRFTAAWAGGGWGVGFAVAGICLELALAGQPRAGLHWC